MSKRIFLFLNGEISEVEQVKETVGERLHFHKVPRNFLELSDELKKLSYLSDAVYVIVENEEMSIFLDKRESLELFTKLVLSKDELALPVNERLKDYLFEHDNA